MDKILVHICCGVDAVWALRRLKEEFPNSEIRGYFYDPNIHPEEEYELRWLETKRVCDELGIECIKGEYELEHWLERTKGLENEPERGERCSVCHDLRLEKSSKLAKYLGFNKITTVLMMSPKKDFEVLKSIGEKTASKYGLEFVAIDFRKKGGVEKMNQLSKEKEIYHQNYCGCLFALSQQRKGDYIPELVSFSKGRVAGSRDELIFIKDLRLFAENLGIKCKEESFQFIGWRLISSILKIDKKPVFHTVVYNSVSLKGIVRAKVKDVIELEDKRILYLNKGNIEIWQLKDKLKEISLDEPRFFTNPIFVVGNETEIKDNSKFELQLKTEFIPNSQSQNLIIGELSSENRLYFYSDTLIDGSNGCNIEDIKEVIKSNLKEILQNKVCIVVFGAKHIGNLGKRFFNERLSETLKKVY